MGLLDTFRPCAHPLRTKRKENGERTLFHGFATHATCITCGIRVGLQMPPRPNARMTARVAMEIAAGEFVNGLDEISRRTLDQGLDTRGEGFGWFGWLRGWDPAEHKDRAGFMIGWLAAAIYHG